jgi:hypothetical protein
MTFTLANYHRNKVLDSWDYASECIGLVSTVESWAVLQPMAESSATANGQYKDSYFNVQKANATYTSFEKTF